jgi:hypothetical protein
MLRAALAATAAALQLGVSGPVVTARGAPMFPVLFYYQCGAGALAAAAAGADFFVEQPYTACSALDPNDFGLAPPPPGVEALSDDYTAPLGAADGGWYLPDEPDATVAGAAGLPQLPPVTETGRLRVVNLSEHFYSGQALVRPGYDRTEYTHLASFGDLVGFDLYPIVKFCGRVSLLDVYRAQRELRTTYAVGKPTFQWIETSPMTGECPTLSVTPAIANAEAWLAVAGGANGIGWFTSAWDSGGWDRWAVSDAMLAQISAIDAQLHALAPVLTTPPGDVVVPWNGSVAASTRSYDGQLWLIAVNAGAQPTTVPMRVDALRGRALNVVGEHRTLKPVKKVYLRDTFGPYQVHVYTTAPVTTVSTTRR